MVLGIIVVVAMMVGALSSSSSSPSFRRPRRGALPRASEGWRADGVGVAGDDGGGSGGGNGGNGGEVGMQPRRDDDHATPPK